MQPESLQNNIHGWNLLVTQSWQYVRNKWVWKQIKPQVLAISSTTTPKKKNKKEKLCILNAAGKRSRLASYMDRPCGKATAGTIALLQDPPCWQWQDGRLATVRGRLEKAFGNLCSALLFLGAGCFGKREFAGNPILPPVAEIFKGDGAGSWRPPFSCWVFPVHTADPSPDKPSFRSTSSATFESLRTAHCSRRPHATVYGGERLHGAVAFISFKKKNNSRSCVASEWEQERDGWERQWQTRQHWESKGRSLWEGNSCQPSPLT